jgi:hypothetical protein
MKSEHIAAAEATARMLAAAPELLSLCKEALAYLGELKPAWPGTDLYRRLMRAIAKAEGELP